MKNFEYYFAQDQLESNLKLIHLNDELDVPLEDLQLLLVIDVSYENNTILMKEVKFR